MTEVAIKCFRIIFQIKRKLVKLFDDEDQCIAEQWRRARYLGILAMKLQINKIKPRKPMLHWILTQRAYICNGEKSCFILQQIHWAETRGVI